AGTGKAPGRCGDPALEDVRGGLPERLAAAGHFQGDGGDWTGVRVVGFAQGLSGRGEEVADGGGDVGWGGEESVDQLEVERARLADHLLAQLLFAAREEVVQGPEGRVGRGNDLLYSGAAEALAPEQLGAGAYYPVPGAGSLTAWIHGGQDNVVRAIYLLDRRSINQAALPPASPASAGRPAAARSLVAATTRAAPTPPAATTSETS